MTQSAVCISCRRPHASLSCGLCSEPICKTCAIALEEGSFQFLATVEPDLSHLYYCAPCHAQKVEPALVAYNQTLADAKLVFFFFDTRKQAIPVLKKAREYIEVTECVDRNETILRLGFMAAAAGFNAIVGADVKCEKVRDHGYQKMKWRGRGWPAKVDGDRLNKHFED